MSLHLHLSARPGELLAALRPRLAAARAAALERVAGIPRPVPVLVPSAQMADWLQARLARDLGLSMGFEFLPPRAYFSRHFASGPGAGEFAAAQAAWNPDRLRWRLLPHVDAIAANLGHDATHPLGPRHRFAFARLLAEQFDRYARFRPDWPAIWAEGRSVFSREPTAPSRLVEAWQRELWLTLANSPATPPHPAQVLARFARTPADADDPAVPLFVIGADLADPLLLRTLGALIQRGQEVFLFLLLPSLGYLGDIARRDAWRTRLAADPAEPSDVSHPLLASLGRQAVGTFLLLENLAPDYAGWPDAPADESPPASLLQQIQSDIREQRPPPGRPAEGRPDPRLRWSPDDRSLRIHCCHSPRRELEVLRDELLRAFADLPQLQPEDVLIAVTDFDRYAPLAEGILRAGSAPLPIRLTALPAREANPVAIALLALLRLAPGRHTASELLDLLNLTAVQLRLDVAGEPGVLAHLADVIRQSGLTHGIDPQDRPDGEPTGSWRSALDRHLAGTWLGRAEAATDAHGLLVHPLAGDLPHDDEAIRGLLAWLTTLACHLQAWREDAPATVWSERLVQAMDDLLVSETVDDHAAALRRRIGELGAVEAPTPLDCGALFDWLQSELENATSLRTSMGGEILLGRLDQIHGLPCRVLAILGLEDGTFPRAARRPAWDLLAQEPQPWDQEPRTQDRQWFLDGVLAPTDRLILCAANRSLRTPHDGPLSSCVEDLLRTAGETAVTDAADGEVAARLVVAHRIQPFAADYFLAGTRLPASFDAAAARIAADLADLSPGPPTPFSPSPGTFVAPVAPEADTALPLERLVAFWSDPARAWLRAMQIDVAGEDPDDTELDDAPVTLTALDSYRVRETALATRLTPAPAGAAVTGRRLSADRLLPPGALGDLSWERHGREVEGLAAQVAPLLAAAETVAVDLAVRPGIRLTGEVRLAGRAAPAPRIVVYRPGNYDGSPRHQLEALVLAAAAAAHLGRPVGAVVLGLDQDPPRELAAIAPADADVLLVRLVTGHAEGQHRPLCFAPRTSTELLPPRTGRSDEPDPIARARSCWEKEAFKDSPGGEGTTPAALLAWRDRDPFAPPLDRDWQDWAHAIAAPLRAWWHGEVLDLAPPAPAPPAIAPATLEPGIAPPEPRRSRKGGAR